MAALISRLQKAANVYSIASSSADNALIGAARRASPAAWARWYSSDGDGEQPTPTPVAESAQETTAVEPASEATPPATEATGPSVEDLMARGYTKRQAIWLNPDPEKHKHFLPRLARKELGSFADDTAAAEFAEESELYPSVPDVPLYNLREVVPEMMQPRGLLFEQLLELQAQFPHETPEQLAQRAGLSFPPEEDAPYPGARRILQWDARWTMVVGTRETHPADRKAKCQVHLRDLGQETGVSLEGLRWIAQIAGPRYNPKSGVLTLTCDQHALREDNRRHILKMLDALVEEGLKFDNNGGSQAATA